MSNDIHFRVVKEIPQGLTPLIEGAVKGFMNDSNLDIEQIDPSGFYNATLESIANSTYLNGGGEFWLGNTDDELFIYILAGVATDIDGRLAYHVYQAWVREDYRGKQIVKNWWEAVRARAKQLMCKHLIVHSSRGYKAYERFLGHGMKHYACLLKESL